MTAKDRIERTALPIVNTCANLPSIPVRCLDRCSRSTRAMAKFVMSSPKNFTRNPIGRKVRIRREPTGEDFGYSDLPFKAFRSLQDSGTAHQNYCRTTWHFFIPSLRGTSSSCHGSCRGHKSRRNDIGHTLLSWSGSCVAV